MIGAHIIHSPSALFRTYQFVKIIGNATDKQFPRAVQAIRNIHAFMARYSTDAQPEYELHVIGETEVIRAENKLLSGCFMNKDDKVIPTDVINPEGVLRSVIEQGGHAYTEDSVVQFEEWKLNDARDM